MAYALDFSPNSVQTGLNYLGVAVQNVDGWIEFEVFLGDYANAVQIARTNSSQETLEVQSWGALSYFVATGTDLSFGFGGNGIPRGEWVIIRLTRSGTDLTASWKSVDPAGSAPNWHTQTRTGASSWGGGTRLGGTGYNKQPDFLLARIERDDGISLTFDADDVANDTFTFSTGESYPLDSSFPTDGSQWVTYTPPGGGGTLTPISTTYALESTLRGNVSASYSLDSELRAEVSTTYSIESSLRVHVAVNRVLTSALRTHVSTSYPIDTSLRAEVASSYTMESNLRAEVSTTYDVTATLEGIQLTRISNVYGLTSQLRERVEKTESLTANLREKVSRTISLEASLLTSIFRTQDLTTSLRTSVSGSYTMESTLRSQVSATSSLLTSLIGRVTRDYTLEARLEALVDWNAPAYRLSLTLDPEANRITLDLSLEELRISLS